MLRHDLVFKRWCSPERTVALVDDSGRALNSMLGVLRFLAMSSVLIPVRLDRGKAEYRAKRERPTP